HPSHWRALVWEELQGNVGRTVKWGRAARSVLRTIPAHWDEERRQERFFWISQALTAYFCALRDTGYLTWEHEEEGRDPGKQLGVLGDLTHPPVGTRDEVIVQ